MILLVQIYSHKLHIFRKLKSIIFPHPTHKCNLSYHKYEEYHLLVSSIDYFGNQSPLKIIHQNCKLLLAFRDQSISIYGVTGNKIILNLHILKRILNQQFIILLFSLNFVSLKSRKYRTWSSSCKLKSFGDVVSRIEDKGSDRTHSQLFELLLFDVPIIIPKIYHVNKSCNGISYHIVGLPLLDFYIRKWDLSNC